MSNVTLDAMKKMVYEFLDAAKKMEDTNPGLTDGLRLSTEKDLKQFLYYLIATDEQIRQAEVKFINDLFGLSLTGAQMADEIAAENIFSMTFESKVPRSLTKYVKLDNILHGKNPEGQLLAELMINCYEITGKLLIGCDGDAKETELNSYLAYLNMMIRYFEEKEPGNPKYSFRIKDADIDVEPEPSSDQNGSDADEKKPEEEKKEKDEEEKTLEELLAELDALTGLASVKREVYSMIHLQDIQRIRKDRGLPLMEVSNHLVFYGNPGTGKTTVARLLAKIYHRMGFLSKGQFIETERAGLIAGYVGQTALKTQQVIEDALGGILFIDEAYTLAGRDMNDYGSEAIATLLKAMEDHRDDFVVIVAGYPALMEQFLASNPGLRSRFSKQIHFPDYDADELFEIFTLFLGKGGFRMTEGCEASVRKLLQVKVQTKKEHFANGREVRNLFEAMMTNQANRLYGKIVTNEDLMLFTEEDLPSEA